MISYSDYHELDILYFKTKYVTVLYLVLVQMKGDRLHGFKKLWVGIKGRRQSTYPLMSFTINLGKGCLVPILETTAL